MHNILWFWLNNLFLFFRWIRKTIKKKEDKKIKKENEKGSSGKFIGCNRSKKFFWLNLILNEKKNENEKFIYLEYRPVLTCLSNQLNVTKLLSIKTTKCKLPIDLVNGHLHMSHKNNFYFYFLKSISYK